MFSKLKGCVSKTESLKAWATDLPGPHEHVCKLQHQLPLILRKRGGGGGGVGRGGPKVKTISRTFQVLPKAVVGWLVLFCFFLLLAVNYQGGKNKFDFR